MSSFNIISPVANIENLFGITCTDQTEDTDHGEFLQYLLTDMLSVLTSCDAESESDYACMENEEIDLIDNFRSNIGLTSVKYESLNTLQVGDPIAFLSNLLKYTVTESSDCNSYLLDLNLALSFVRVSSMYVGRIELKEISNASNYHS